MRMFNKVIDEKYFNLLLRALSEREAEMVSAIDHYPNSDESALLSNDLVYLRLCEKELEDNSRSAFTDRFSLLRNSSVF